MKWPEREQRETLRTPYACSVSYMAMGQAGQGEIINLGDGGARIRTALHKFEIGTMIVALITFSRPSITVPVFGLVRWVKEEHGARYEIGLQFLV
jgi:hypothetical protein